MKTPPGPARIGAALVAALTGLAVLTGLAGLAAAPATALDTPPAARAADDRPNIVLITTDDQTLADLYWMPATRAALGGAGATFGQAISPHPLCCPARAEMVTGQYAQNNGVRSNSGPHGGFGALKEPGNTVASWLHDAGYATGFVGKYLNLYSERDGIQAGWDHWAPITHNTYQAFDYSVFDNGTRVEHHDDLHSNDFVSQRTVDLVERYAAADEPFLVWSSYVAPHGQCTDNLPLDVCAAPPTPAARHAGLYSGSPLPSLGKPSFNEADVSDKPIIIRKQKRVRAANLQRLFTQRIRALASVDEGVAATVEALRAAGELDNTYLVFTSDNGYLLGEHRYNGKVLAYRESLRVPMLIRGPGIPAGVVRQQRVSTIDLAPTMVEIAGAVPGRPMDGVSMLAAARADAPLPRTSLIQAGPFHRRGTIDWTYRGVYTGRYTFVRWNRTGFVELYDHARDPYELRNLGTTAKYGKVRRELFRRTNLLSRCSGDACRVDFGPVPRPRR
ncbi:sulfatase family protein [Nocardioides sp. LHG3406-4]|uniref:sulfatase family protein n=1 Tax=Nocardioides sp. LHG3406-4 TaxID=2804575 RepID=UPI003CFBAA5C